MGGGWRCRATVGLHVALAVLGSGCVLPRLPAPRPFESIEQGEAFEPLEPAGMFAVEPRPPAPAPRELQRRPTGLKLRVDPPDAALFVNGVARGPANRALAGNGTLELAPGLYRIVVERPGRQTWRGEVAVGAQLVPIEVSLPESE